MIPSILNRNELKVGRQRTYRLYPLHGHMPEIQQKVHLYKFAATIHKSLRTPFYQQYIFRFGKHSFYQKP